MRQPTPPEHRLRFIRANEKKVASELEATKSPRFEKGQEEAASLEGRLRELRALAKDVESSVSQSIASDG